MINQDKRRHRLHDHHRAGNHTGVVPTAPFELSALTLQIHRFLQMHDRGGRLETDPKNNLFAIADASLHAAGIISGSVDLTGLGDERVVML